MDNEIKQWFLNNVEKNHLSIREWNRYYEQLFRAEKSELFGFVNFRTESGSIYEVNPLRKKIRRVAGDHEPTKFNGDDGNWKEYSFLTLYGYPNLFRVLIGYDQNADRTTLTTPLKSLSYMGQLVQFNET